jgi:membrane protease subunit HflC
MNSNDFNTDRFKDKAEEVKASAKKIMKYGGLFFVLILILGSLNSFLYIVEEDEVALVKQFGKISRIIVDTDNTLAEEQNKLIASFSDIEIVKKKGLFFKIPFITQIEKDSSKLNTYISNSANINTRDKIKYEIAMYAQWEITHPGLFRSSMGTVNKANSVIDEIGYAAVIEKVNSLTSRDFLTDKEKLTAILELAKEELNEDLALKGIALIDIEVYRTILPPSNIESTYAKMIAEREAIAEQKRAEGLELYQNTVSDTDKEVATINAESIETSEKILGEADATALEIYANAFSIDPGFYEFWRSLQSYENAFDENTVIYLDRNNDFLKYFSGN